MEGKNSTENVYKFIKTYLRSHGYSPTQREIAAGCGLSGPMARLDLVRLEERGRISSRAGNARRIRLVDHDD